MALNSLFCADVPLSNDSLTSLLTDSSSHTCSRRHPHWPIRSKWPTATASPTLQFGLRVFSVANLTSWKYTGSTP